MVVAGANLIEQRRLHFDAEQLALGLLDVDLAGKAASIDLEADIGLVDQHPVLDDVSRDFAVDAQQHIACDHTSPIGW